MSSTWVFAAYVCAVGLPLVLLRFFGARAWYWHALSIGLALALGLTPTPSEWSSPSTDLMIGSAFVFLLVWGLAAPFFRSHHAMHPKAG
ncbi:MAG: hypothetical protein LAP39_16870 [Acidobacteriia bacterium]|nr:hypothetical protein [Terriglobia bacterium]